MAPAHRKGAVMLPDDEAPLVPLLVFRGVPLELSPLARLDVQMWGGAAIAESGRADAVPVTVHPTPARAQ